jgi:hypothetical protein
MDTLTIKQIKHPFISLKEPIEIELIKDTEGRCPEGWRIGARVVRHSYIISKLHGHPEMDIYQFKADTVEAAVNNLMEYLIMQYFTISMDSLWGLAYILYPIHKVWKGFAFDINKFKQIYNNPAGKSCGPGDLSHRDTLEVRNANG